MTKHAEVPADRSDAAVRLAKLSEAELSIATGGTTGAGAGKITFNPLPIIKVVDKASPNLFI